ncbi:NADH kinase POS5 [Lasiodiplodia hormozganensis]|uniref:NADH kinase POS5 n=1 Tax=Lasiodiplodia hormozganensis TaxID=869390 RepID=A0AA39XCJ2_9PEZI|nr:NADH kinase POS5 [Lasiodiplodia hormozganensis]
MQPRLPLRLRFAPARRAFSCTARRSQVIELPQAGALPERDPPTYQATRQNDLLGLHWHSPLRTVLLMKKEDSPHVTESLIELAYHVQTTYPDVNLLFEPSVACEIHDKLPSPVYALPFQKREAEKVLHDNVDLITTLGGDGTILHAAGLYANAQQVPPILAFSMGTLGFLGEWKFAEYKRAFREVYMSGASAAAEQMLGRPSATDTEDIIRVADDPWASLRGKFMGTNRHARILLRHRLKVSVHPPPRLASTGTSPSTSNPASKKPLLTGKHPSLATAQTLARGNPKLPPSPLYALNEIILHRGRSPHLTHISITVNGRHLTDAIADGLIVASPTGSTAYSLSSGGCIVHPLVPSLILTPISPRSLSFRPLVLPANADVALRVAERNRAEGVDVSIDGMRLEEPLGRGGEVRITGEDVGLRALGRGETGVLLGGVPSIVRGTNGVSIGEDHWVGGLNGLLKFNYPFGEEV